jgi:putative hemolysin
MVILILLVLMVVNALFAMAEMALVSSRRARLQQFANEGNAGAATALELSAHPDRFLSTVQIGLTLISILTGAFGERALVVSVAQRLEQYPQIAHYSHTAAFVIVIAALTYVTLVIGELVPKRLALLNPERLASFFAGPLSAVSSIASPAVHLLTASTRLVLKLMRAKAAEGPPVTEEEIKVMLEQGTEAGVFEEAEHDMMKSLLKLGDRAVDALMKPRREVVWLNVDDSWEENRKKMASSLYSRFPVGQGSLDNVLGVVQTKDLLIRCLSGSKLDLREAMRVPLFVPEGLPAMKLLEMFKKSRTHIALIVDEYGGVEGLITINDVLEDIVGEVASADMPAEKMAVKRADGSWLIDGRMLIDEVKETIGVQHLPDEDSGSYNTLGGFVMLQMGRVPVTGDAFELQGYRFEVVDMDEKRVDRVLVSERRDAENAEERSEVQ